MATTLEQKAICLCKGLQGVKFARSPWGLWGIRVAGRSSTFAPLERARN